MFLDKSTFTLANIVLDKDTCQGKTCHIFPFTLPRKTCQGKLASVNGALQCMVELNPGQTETNLNQVRTGFEPRATACKLNALTTGSRRLLVEFREFKISDGEGRRKRYFKI